MKIDTTTYPIDDINRYKAQPIKTQIVIASSLRKDSNHITRLKHKESGKTKKWNTYTISRNGDIYRHYDDKYYTDFLGIKEADKQSISIVLENMGCLFRTDNNEFVNGLNEICDKDSVQTKKWLGYNNWECFSTEQIESCVLLCLKICTEYNIIKDCIEFQTFHKEINKFKGIVFRSNYIEDSSDINPLFDIEKFNKLLHE